MPAIIEGDVQTITERLNSIALLAVWAKEKIAKRDLDAVAEYLADIESDLKVANQMINELFEEPRRT